MVASLSDLRVGQNFYTKLCEQTTSLFIYIYESKNSFILIIILNIPSRAFVGLRGVINSKRLHKSKWDGWNAILQSKEKDHASKNMRWESKHNNCQLPSNLSLLSLILLSASSALPYIGILPSQYLHWNSHQCTWYIAAPCSEKESRISWYFFAIDEAFYAAINNIQLTKIVF